MYSNLKYTPPHTHTQVTCNSDSFPGEEYGEKKRGNYAVWDKPAWRSAQDWDRQEDPARLHGGW